jgi:hypothetical protein
VEYFRILILLLLAMPAMAIKPPAPVTPAIAAVLYSWALPTTRVSGAALAPAERKETRLYISSLSAYIAIPEAAASYTYIVPAGQCIRKTDIAAVTAVDTEGRESAGSMEVSTVGDVCGPKALPAAPTSVKVAIGS